MARDDWFRNEQWDAVTEAHFLENVRRAKGKAQPLRIQAGYLVATYPRTALALLDKYFALGDHFDKAQAFLDQAEAHLALGEQEQALQSLRDALQREREFPNLRTQAWSRYALLVAVKRLEHLYESALQVLRENPVQPHWFPVDSFRWNAAFALIADAQGLRDYAEESANQALKFANLSHSGFRHHPDVGLVGSDYDRLKKELGRIVQR